MTEERRGIDGGYRCVEEEREYGSSVPMQMRLDEIV